MAQTIPNNDGIPTLLDGKFGGKDVGTGGTSPLSPPDGFIGWSPNAKHPVGTQVQSTPLPQYVRKDNL